MHVPQTDLDGIHHEIQTVAEEVKEVQEEMATISATMVEIDKKIREIWISTMDPDSQLGAHLE